MKYTQELIDYRLDEALRLFKMGWHEQGANNATLAIALMMRNQYKEPIVLDLGYE